MSKILCRFNVSRLITRKHFPQATFLSLPMIVFLFSHRVVREGLPLLAVVDSKLINM